MGNEPGHFDAVSPGTPGNGGAGSTSAPERSAAPSRRAVMRTGLGAGLAGAGGIAGGGGVIAALSGCSADPDVTAVASGMQDARTFELNQGWLFGGVYTAGSAEPGFDDSGFDKITLPHTVTSLSWRNWDPADWQRLWVYRRHFRGSKIGFTGPGTAAASGLRNPRTDASPPETGGAGAAGQRVFADFDGVMTNALVLINGHQVASHQGGYLPFSVELTRYLGGGDNVLAVVADARWLPVPPDGAADGPQSVDYLQPGGIYRDVTLRVVPQVFLSDVFAKPVNVLSADRTVQVQATIDAATVPSGPVTVTAQLSDGSQVISSSSTKGRIARTGQVVADLSLGGLPDVTLWSPDNPKLYTVQTTLSVPGGPGHALPVRIGFRDASFGLDGFYLNGERLKLFGLNRHQLYPFIGMAAGERLQRRDAEILKYDLNCNMVRCSHYPQSPHFLDACDELGLLVWEEAPSWHYIGGPGWQQLSAQNTHDMVVRDRNRPSVVVWGTRLNETPSADSGLYTRNRQIADQADGSRQTGGAVETRVTQGWPADVYGFNDYHLLDQWDAEFGVLDATLEPPLPGVPYLVTEAVGARDAAPNFRWTDPGGILAKQAIKHAQAHDIARADERYAGMLGWAGFDYASLNGHIWDGVKWPGVADMFRVLKPGAAIYRSQADPSVRPVVIPVFFWDFGPASPAGPGPSSMIATNCDRLEIYVGGRHVGTGWPDRTRFGNLAYPPVFTDLVVLGPSGLLSRHGLPAEGQQNLLAAGGRLPELRIDGYVGPHLVTSLSASADTTRDGLALEADDDALQADGADATRITFRAVDAYGNQRPYGTGEVTLAVDGPAEINGDNPFAFGAYGGVGGAFIRSLPGRTGPVTVTASHPALGSATARITVTAPPPGRQLL